MNSEATKHQNADYVPDWAWERMKRNDVRMIMIFSVAGLLGLILPLALVELVGMDQIPAVLIALVLFLSLFLFANFFASSDDTSFIGDSQGFDALPLWAQKKLSNARRTMVRAFAAGGVTSILLTQILTAMFGHFITIVTLLFGFTFGVCIFLLPVEEDFELTEEEIEEGIVQ